jgi:hypothetical protein
MKNTARTIARRELLVRTAPACAMACLGFGGAERIAAALAAPPRQEGHKFDRKEDRSLSSRDAIEMMSGPFFEIIGTLRGELGDLEAIRILKVNSAEMGRKQGVRQAEQSPDTSFESFVSVFREMASGEYLTADVVQDTEGVFELRVSECIWATVFKEAGLLGDVGHAAICNMDYAWPPAFNPDFKMERTKTLMQGHDCCNHRYINTAVE